jgi:ATP-dependent Zn protease
MASADVAAPRGLGITEESVALAAQLRQLARVATAVALLTSPALILWLHREQGWPLWTSILGGLGGAIAFRGLVDIFIRRLIPWPSLFGVQDERQKEADVTNRRRAWFWRSLYKWTIFFWGPLALCVWAIVHYAGWAALLQLLFYVVILPFFLIFNFVILFGPLMLVGITQMRGFEPGDADWGVRLGDVRGQAEAKEEVRKIVTLWQSGEGFERAGGKRERGLLFHGPPGTGKTMLAKAIATSFNAPFVSMPGSGFAQTFIGMDAVIVRWLARKAKKLARKWGGQCIVFIDEIDAVGMRRASLAGGGGRMTAMEELEGTRSYYGPYGALNPSGDLVVESRAWRDHMFGVRAPEPRSPYPPFVHKIGNVLNQAVPGGMFGMGGQLALNQLLVVMDGIDNPPFLRRALTNLINKCLDATYIVPRRVGSVSLRIRAPRPRKEQIYFIGATNVPLQNLDPALTRPGRMGRHVWFRTPTKEDRKDIFDLYLGKVAHAPDLDEAKRRDEVARITNGYSPAMIDQVCSVALTYAHHEGRAEFDWHDLLEAMSVIESGAAINVKYVEHETRAVAVHEAGHAAAAHVYRPEVESSRLSIRMRPGSLGHHQSFEREERFTRWQREYFGDLIHGLAAMAAEQVFYGENAGGVGGDLEYATLRAAEMVGVVGMGPMPIDLDAARFADESGEQTRKRLAQRFEKVGLQLMNRTRGSVDAHADPIASILHDPAKRAAAAQILGQAYVTAFNFVRDNRRQVARLADELVEKRELYGDDLIELLDAQDFRKAKIDWRKDETWPQM